MFFLMYRSAAAAAAAVRVAWAFWRYDLRGASEVGVSIKQKAAGVVCNVPPGTATCGPDCRERRRPAGAKHPTLVQTLVSTLVSTLVANDPPTDPKH